MNEEADALIESLKSSKLSELAVDIGNKQISEILSSGLSGEIPILKTIIAGYKLSLDLPSRLFARQVARFLANLNCVPMEERKRLVARLSVDIPKREELAEALVAILNRTDGATKPDWMANAFVEFAEERIDQKTLLRLLRCADKFDPSYADELREFYTGNEISTDAKQHIAMSGLAVIVTGFDQMPSEGLSIEPNELGKLFVERMV